MNAMGYIVGIALLTAAFLVMIVFGDPSWWLVIASLIGFVAVGALAGVASR